jgi:8-oxo-dGTP pyrophosphatase MutT (NUDIX family)
VSDTEFEVVGSEPIFDGKLISVRRDTVRMPDGSEAERELVTHPGAVGILALDAEERVVIVNQFRPAVRARLDELPAGLLDVRGEPALETAKRELAEEALLQAEQWHVLVDLYSSPGFSDETVRIFLARELSDAPRPHGFVVEHEEIDLAVRRIPLDDAVRRVLAGTITNAAAIGGILAAAAARTSGWRELRPPDAPWPARDR